MQSPNTPQKIPKGFLASAKAEFRLARRVLVASHINPDPDAVSSALALARLLKRSGKRVTIFLAGFSRTRYEGLHGIRTVKSRLPREPYDLVVGLDYGKLKRLFISALLEQPVMPRLISIDHHPKQDQRGNAVWIDPAKSSTAEMIYDLAKALALPIDSRTAFYLLFGIVGDTVGFSTPSSTASLFKKVIDLMERGGSLTKAQELTKEWLSPELMKLAAKALLRAKLVPQKQFAYSWVTEKEWKSAGVESGTLSIVANNLRAIRGISVSLLLVEQRGKWHCHLRSRAESRKHLGKLAERFGGGGHAHAAGFETKLPRDTIVKQITASLPKRK